MCKIILLIILRHICCRDYTGKDYQSHHSSLVNLIKESKSTNVKSNHFKS